MYSYIHSIWAYMYMYVCAYIILAMKTCTSIYSVIHVNTSSLLLSQLSLGLVTLTVQQIAVQGIVKSQLVNTGHLERSMEGEREG